MTFDVTLLIPNPFPTEVPLIALQAAMPMKDMATSTGTFGFLRYRYITSWITQQDYSSSKSQKNSWGHSWHLHRPGHLFKRTFLFFFVL